MSESKDRSDASKAKTFDDAWESLPEPSDGSAGGTKAWNEEIRGARKHDGDPVAVEDHPPERTDETRAWTEEVRGARKQDAPGVVVPKQDEMDRLMREKPAGEAPPEENVEASASTSTMSFDALDLPERAKPDDSMMDALMGSDVSHPVESKAVSASEDGPADGADDAAKAAESPGGASAVSEDDGEEPPAPIVLHPETSADAPTLEPSLTRKSSSRPSKWRKKRLPLLVGGTVAAGLAFWLGREPHPKAAPDGKDPVAAAADLDAKSLGPATPSISPDPVHAKPDVGTPQPKLTPDRQPPPPSDPDLDPREPPAGTSAEAAAVFKKLPVSPADRAPVGGVGNTGIHIDDVSMGSIYERSRCSGAKGSFSVGKGDLVNVCLRVVHQRQKEELSVVWQRVGGNARRGKIVVKPMHAYRTRAYLKLRSEYVGDWEVKVFSADGAQLARYPFTIVP
ncbi:MAG: DUF2914 domain-containing protein [Nannocystaceae bacterium]|nr:DUF2914 domain-containing protein [Nannocystaceae bacterium]